MGLAGFNRSRRSRLPVEEHEAERFKKDNAARWAAHHGTDTNRKQEEKDLDKGRALEAAAVAEIGEKAEAGIEQGERRGGIDDLFLRQDHAAEIAGRTLENNQEPKDPVERLRERIPTGTANEEMVKHTQVDQPGPSAKLVEAVILESTPEADRESVKSALKADAKVAAAEHEKVLEEKERRLAGEAEVAEVAETAETEEGAGSTTEPKSDESEADDELLTAAQKEAKLKSATAAKEAKLPAAGKSAGAGSEPASGEKKTAAKKTGSGK